MSRKVFSGIFLLMLVCVFAPSDLFAQSTPPAPVVNITVEGQSGSITRTAPTDYVVSWTSQNAVSCVTEGTWGGVSKPTSSSWTFNGVSVLGLKTYGMRCTDSSGNSASATVTVDIVASSGGGGGGSPPSVTLTADGVSGSITKTAPASYTLSWNVQNSATTCTAEGSWSGSKNITSGSQTFSNETGLGNRTYTLICTNSAGSGSASVSVVVSSGDTTPPVVSSVSASSITSSSAVITWITNEPATGFVNYGSNSQNWAVTPTDTSYITSHSITLSNLTGGTLYTYRVYSVDASGNGPQGYPPEYTFTTTAANVSTASVPTVTINADGATGTVTRLVGATYSIFWSVQNGATSCVAGGAWSGNKSVSGGYEAMTPSTVAVNKTYTLTCTNSAGSSSHMSVTVNIVSSTSGGGGGGTTISPPSAPTNLTATVSGANVVLSWTDNSNNENGFKMYRGPTWTDIGNVAANVTTFTDSNRPAGTYTYHLNAFANGSSSLLWSGISNDITVTVAAGGGGGGGGDTTPPSTITGLWTASSTSQSVDLRWYAPGNDGTSGTASSYVLKYSTTGAITESTWSSATSFSGTMPTPAAYGTSQSVTVSGLNSGTTYWFAIKAHDSSGNYSLSNSPYGTTATTSGGGGGTSIAIISAGHSNVSGSSATINIITNVNSYGYVRYNTTPNLEINATGAAWVSSSQQQNTTHNINLTGLIPGTTYYYRVLACPAYGAYESDCRYLDRSFTALSSGGGGGELTAPAAPTNFSATLSGNNIVLSWTDSSTNENWFTLYRQSNGNWSTISQVGANATSSMDTPPAGTYYYQVSACGTSLCSPGVNIGPIYVGVSSSTVSATKPVAPTNLTAVQSGNNVVLSWTDNSNNEAGFKIYRGPVWTDKGNGGANTNSFTDFNVLQGSYVYHINAFTGATPPVYSDVSNDVGITVVAGTSTGATTNAPPDNIRFSLSSDRTKVTVSWNDNSTNEGDFRIQRMLGNGPLVNFYVPANTTSTEIAAGQPGIYSYVIFACPIGGSCLISQNVSFTVPSDNAITPSSTANITATSSIANLSTMAPTELTLSYSDGKIRLNWKDNSLNESGFKIERMIGSGSWTQAGAVSANQSYYEDVISAPGRYEYQVAACVTGGTCAFGPRSAIEVSYFPPRVEIFADGYTGGIKRPAPAYYTISWKVQNGATRCVAEGTWGGDKNTVQSSQGFNGVIVPGPKTYSLICSNSAGSGMATVTVDIVSAEIFGTATSTGSTPQAGTTAKEGVLVGRTEDNNGQALAGVPIHIFSKDFSFTSGSQSDSSGYFRSYLPAGTYIVEAYLPPGRMDIFRPSPQEVSVAPGLEKAVTLKFAAPNKTVTGAVKYYTGEIVNDSKVGAYSSQTGQWTYADVNESGIYDLRLGPGSWQLKVFPRNGAAARWQAGTAVQEVSFSSAALAENRIVNFVILLSNSAVKVKVVDASGQPVGKVGLVLDTVSGASQVSTATDRPAPIFRPTNENGEAEIPAPPRTYFLRVQLPPDSAYLPPEETKLELVFGDTKQLFLVLKNRSALETIELSGITKLDNGKPVGAYIWGWFEKGGQVQAHAGEDGKFRFAARPNSRLHLGAGKEVDGYAYKTSDIIMDIGSISPAGQVELILAKIATGKIAPPVTISQSAAQEVVVQSEDGARVNIPANTVAGGGEISVKVDPTVEAPSQGAAKVVGTAYDVNVQKSNGEEIKSFAQEIEITLPYDEGSIKKQGLTLDTVVPSYYDEATGSWVKVDSFVVNKEKKMFVLKVKHLTRFALVAATDTTPPVSPDNVKATPTGSGEIILAWKNPTKDFSHVKIYRSVSKSSLGAIVINDYAKQEYKDAKNIISGTTYYYLVRAVDPAGNESTNTAPVTAVAKASSASAAGKIKNNLKFGMRSAEVKAMQEVLIGEGLLPADSATGYFGNLTKAAIIQFQEKYAEEILAPADLVKGNGFVGSLTRAKLNSLLP
ncbi:MAG: fibronectin type III domain-containing protein [Candidatus Liptonbacteria bacterium]